MEDKALTLLGLMRRANAIQIGETNTGPAVKSGKAKILVIARDASDNAKHRAQDFAAGRRNTQLVELPYTKEQISGSVGVTGCSMAAITDLGFANALMKLLSERDETYAESAEITEQRFIREKRRKLQTGDHESNKRRAKRRANA